MQKLLLDEQQKMFLIDGKQFTVPDIKDRDIKRNREIREFFGDPKP